MALVHPVEPLKNPVLMFCRNANTGIADNQTVVFCVDRYTAAWNIVLDGIVAEIINDLLEHSSNTHNSKTCTGHIDPHIHFSCASVENFLYILRQSQHIHFFSGQLHTFIQLRKSDDIFNQIHQTGSFLADMTYKTRGIFWFHHAAFQQFGAADNTLQRCLQFVGHICRKLAAHLF